MRVINIQGNTVSSIRKNKLDFLLDLGGIIIPLLRVPATATTTTTTTATTATKRDCPPKKSCD